MGFRIIDGLQHTPPAEVGCCGPERGGGAWSNCEFPGCLASRQCVMFGVPNCQRAATRAGCCGWREKRRISRVFGVLALHFRMDLLLDLYMGAYLSLSLACASVRALSLSHFLSLAHSLCRLLSLALSCALFRPYQGGSYVRVDIYVMYDMTLSRV